MSYSTIYSKGAFHLVRTHLGGWVGSSLLYISIVYYMQKVGGWVQIACKIAYVLNGRPQMCRLSNGHTGEMCYRILLHKNVHTIEKNTKYL